MIRGIVGWSLQFRFLMVVLTVVVMFYGIAQLRDMPVDVLPEFAPPYVEVQAEALGLSTAEVESLVTVNLERLLSGIPGLQTIRSRSVPGLSSILLIFERGTNIMRARLLVQERLTLARSLPHVSKLPAMLQPTSATSRVMMIGLSSQELSLIEMSVLARWNIKPRLLSVPGVANVSIWGQRERQMQVQVDPKRLQANGVSLYRVIEASGNALWTSPLSYLFASYPSSGGWIDTPQQRVEVRHVLPVSTPEDLAQVTIEARDGAPLLLRDVAEVVEGHPLLIGDAILKNGPGLLLVVEKFPGSNTLEVTRGVEEVLEALRRGLPGIEIDAQVFRAANFIEMALGNLTRTIIVSAILVVVVLFAFVWEWRVALISLAAIPLSLMAALLVLYLNGATINTMVLAGLVVALGAVVDDAIIDVENIVRRIRQHRQAGTFGQSTAAIILEASVEMRGAIVFATLVVLLFVLPIFFLQGLSGAFFQPLAGAYALALLASMGVALTVTPALGLILLSHAPLERRQSPLVHWLQRGYQGLLARIVQRPRAAYATVTVFVVAGLAVLPFLGQELFPAFKERDLVIRWEDAPGTSHPKMTRTMVEASRELQAIPGVRSVNAHVGRAVVGDQVVGIHSAKLWLSLDPQADYDATLAAIQEAVDGYPGLVRNVQTYLQEIIRQVLAASDKAVVVRIYGPDFVVLPSLAEKVGQVISQIDGVVDLQTDSLVEEPHVEVEVDLAKAGRYGLIPGDVRRAAAAFVAGLEVGDIFKEKKVFEVVVWAIPQARHSLTSLRELLIDTPGGGQVRLGEVAEVRVAATPTLIRHEANAPYIDVGFNVHGRDLGAVVRDVERALQDIEFPLEYHPELIGEYAERQTALQRMLGVVLAAAIGILLLLQAAFDNWRLAFLAFLALPAALVGGVLAAGLGGGILSLGSLVGFLTVLGIAARNGILLINHYQHLEQHEGETFGPGLVLRGARERLAPILMTALTTTLVLVTLVIAGDIPGQEIEYPMAIVILGGLVTATLHNLFVIPALYLRFGSRLEPGTSS